MGSNDQKNKLLLKEVAMGIKVIRKNSFFLLRWYIRWYIWAWKPNLATLTDCQLFWGTLFFPLAFLSNEIEFKIMPRLSLLYAGIAMILLACGAYNYSAVLLLAAIMLIPLSWLYRFIIARAKKNPSKLELVTATIDDGDYFSNAEVFLDKFYEKKIGCIIITLIASFIGKIIDLKEAKCSFVIVE